jgi:hypothetical protein
MKKTVCRIGLWFIALTVIVFCLAQYGTAHAHERRAVGEYEFVVGFIVEPAFEGIKNGVDLRVQIPAGAEGEAPTPVVGLEETVQVEVTHIPSGVSAVMSLRTIFRDPGHFTADLIPTAPGPYRFRFFGLVEDLTVDETLESGEDTFNSREPAEGIQFPESQPQMREVASALRGTQDATQQALAAAQQAEAAAASARLLAVIGMVLGAFGILFGVGSVVLARRQR